MSFCFVIILKWVYNDYFDTDSDQSPLSAYSITILANTQVMRIKEMIIQHEMS